MLVQLIPCFAVLVVGIVAVAATGTSFVAGEKHHFVRHFPFPVYFQPLFFAAIQKGLISKSKLYDVAQAFCYVRMLVKCN